MCNCFRRRVGSFLGLRGVELTGSSRDCGVGRVFFGFVSTRGGVRRVCGVCCFDVVETSYEGHMVDALASRADEGRWSLR